MKIFNLIISLFILLLSCAEKSNSHNKDVQIQEEFEGIITYKIETKSNLEGVSDKRLQEVHTGNKLVKHIKGANYYSQAIGPSGAIISESLNLDDEGISRGYLSQMDTVITTPCDKLQGNVEILSIETGPNKTLLNYDCESIIVKFNQPDPRGAFIAQYTYYFAREFPKPKNRNQLCIDTLDSYITSMILGWEISGYPVCDQKIIPISMQRTQVSDTIFKIRSGK
jgi:hypothetical protein